ncbi:hypothetical protein [Acidocella aminolytica]|uniref:Uncharacterized protein n=1 Tax=Acidocella aminolytica 101 = DSM 11237 TaxID=1120923 RepID=A0A0D6PJS9_9PROT|nr:hypothetical protein [Acidocella aminolytica]GAN81651.1 hypothetical protein Aam_108_022 [Acidocella aminolytica 101 = DSM 11237]GBQ44132.1 hypothetical protein AA11237_3463 [Acidocella aminolytica 101 = DSM 11237]
MDEAGNNPVHDAVQAYVFGHLTAENGRLMREKAVFLTPGGNSSGVGRLYAGSLDMFSNY